jgi:hypothetical protein
MISRFEGVKLDEKIQTKLRKLMALAERGVGGEKETARRMLEKMLARHGLTIESLTEEERSIAWFKFSHENERRLGRQLAAKVLNSRDSSAYALYRSPGRKKQFGVMLTPAEAVEFDLHYDVLRKALAVHTDIAYCAFIQANNVFPDRVDDEASELTERDLAVVAMASVTAATEINPRIGRGSKQ